MSFVGLIPQWVTPLTRPRSAIPVGFCGRRLGAGQRRRRVPGAPPTAPPARPPHTFPARAAVAGLFTPAPRLAPAALLADHPLQDAGGHRLPEVVCKDTRPRPLCLRGDGPSARQPRSAPTSCQGCGVLLLPRGRLGGQALPTAPLPTRSVPTSSSSLCRVDSHSWDLPRGHASTCPRAQRQNRAPPFLPLSCTTRAVVRGHPHHLCLPSVLNPAQTDPSRSALCGQQLHSPPHKRGLPGSWVHSSKCGWPGVLQHSIRVPQTQAWAWGWLWTPVTIQRPQRLFPTPTPDSNASNSAPYEVATKPLLLSTDHTEVCKISPQFLKQTRSFHTSGEAPLSSSGHPGDTQKRSAPRPLPVLMHGQP